MHRISDIVSDRVGMPSYVILRTVAYNRAGGDHFMALSMRCSASAEREIDIVFSWTRGKEYTSALSTSGRSIYPAKLAFDVGLGKRLV